MWKLKTYKTREGDYASVWGKELGINPMAINAVKQRIDWLYTSGLMFENWPDEDDFDLSLHRNRQKVGYNYLEWKED
jgi:hypothetical protein